MWAPHPHFTPPCSDVACRGQRISWVIKEKYISYSTGTKKHWDTRTLGHQDTGTPGHWDTRTPGHWNTRTLDNGTPGHGDTGTQGQNRV